MGDFNFDFKRDYECYVYYFNVKGDNIMGEINDKKYILISIARLRLDDEFLTLWQKNNQGYTDDLFNAGIYTELKDGYHDSDRTVPVLIGSETYRNLDERRNEYGEMGFLNNEKNRQMLGLILDNGKIKRNDKAKG